VMQRAAQIRMRPLLNRNRLETVDPYAELDQNGNPYTELTLNMRRKAEILKHNPVGSGSGTITRSAHWASMSRNRSIASKTIHTFMKTTTIGGVTTQALAPCPTVPLPVYYSDVPWGGNTNMLYLDESVPLYNFINPVQERNYNMLPPDPAIDDTTVSIVDKDVNIPQNQSGRVATIMFTQHITMSTAVMFLQIPLAINISGIATYFDSSTSSNKTVTITPNVELCYNDVVIPGIYNYTKSFGSVFNLTFPGNTGVNFNLSQYIGYITVHNIFVQAIPNAVYTVRVHAEIVFSPAFDTSTLGATLTANIQSIANTNDSHGAANFANSTADPFPSSIDPWIMTIV
jgi:hypothetical protein